MTKSDTISKLSSALCKAQAEMKAIAFDSQNPFLKNRYASLGALIESSRPILAKHGLAIVQMPVNDGASVGVETMLCHESGEWLANRITMPMGDEKGKSMAQLVGSIISYQRRYSLGAFLNSYADEDTDGHTQTQPSPVPAPARAIPKRIDDADVPTKNVKPVPHSERLARMMTKFSELGVLPKEVQAFAVAGGYILPNESAEKDWPESKMPATKQAFDDLCDQLIEHAQKTDNIP